MSTAAILNGKQPSLRFLFDNNFLSVLRKDASGKKIERFNQSILEKKIIPGPTKAESLVSPFTLLEVIGSPHKQIRLPRLVPPKELLVPEKVEDLKHFLFDGAFNYYSTHPDLSRDEIKAAVDVERTKGTAFGKQLFEETIAHNTDRTGFENRLYQALAFDYIQRFQYPAPIEDYVVASFLGDITRAPSHDWNISWARIIAYGWKRISPELERTGQVTAAERYKVKKRGYCFKSHTDLLDTEVIHYASVGWLANGEMHPVICFTCDASLEKTHFRMALYKTLANQAEEALVGVEERTGKKLPFTPIPLRSGTIAICSNQTGEVLHILSADKIISDGKLVI